MPSSKTTLLTHIYNEEYLLPFWLHHHKDMFDDIIIIDYRSTDTSLDICKSICPNCKIIPTKNPDFGAKYIDSEVMDIENSIDGIKVALNTTEFLICETPIKELFSNLTTTSYSAIVNSPYSKQNYIVNELPELFNNLLNDDVVFHQNRWTRQIHNFPNGNYQIGRHGTNNPSIPTDKLHIIWMGFYPLNDNLLNRKLQIQQNIPQSDKMKGWGIQHLYSKEKILSVNNEKANSGKSLKSINLPLYQILNSQYNNK